MSVEAPQSAEEEKLSEGKCVIFKRVTHPPFFTTEFGLLQETKDYLNK